MLLARAEVEGRIRDVRFGRDGVEEVAERIRPRRDEDVIDARRRAVVPGLHDHHVHLRALAAAQGSVDLRLTRDEDELREALAGTGAEPGQWVRAIGYHESIAGELDRTALDGLTPPGVPVRVQHRSGVLWTLNSAAVSAAGLDDRTETGVDVAAGRLWRRDDLLRRVSTLGPDRLERVGLAASTLGVTGLTDATPGGAATDARDLAHDLRRAGVRQNLHLMAPVGAIPPDQPRCSIGPVKILLDDDRLPALEDLTATVTEAHRSSRAVAVHCVTTVQLVLTVSALETAGATAGDRIEHGSVIPPDLVDTLVRLGVTVVTQPHFVAERGDDYLRDVAPEDRRSLYRVRSLLDAGVAVAAGTDAPFGSSDPWASMAAAVERRTRSGHTLGDDERVDVAAALALYLGSAGSPARPRAVEPGAPADLCLLRVPMRRLGATLADEPVETTIIAGEVAYQRR